ncbi:hypothetical protein K458DRAFT_415847 [Lentithecium fluviatile CBS 122367]|uniref:Pal1-domain-containing protein n=1 Tax=Lentithecium fluviatile CBS 122367 TaxID=1168545 RepID=A0A6G1J7H1_9PLEO|nr:hypothetical protein K458DRAFT_415847 [Lentithecium fluviatile CBS 122367]
MPIRNPFRRAGAVEALDDAQRSASEHATQGSAPAGTKPLQIKDPAEYKLSEINDSGVYLPPSPHQEKPSFWHSKSNTSITSSNHRSLLSENEPFSISRESFESYRRSFDISARSPIPECLDGMPRQSLDARRSMDTRRSLDVRRSRAPPRSSMQETRRPEFASEATAEEGFEDVGLQDEPKPQKKRGLFARFGDNNDADTPKEERPSSSHHFGFTGRKRAQSNGQGSEMKSFAPVTPQPAEVSVEAR